MSDLLTHWSRDIMFYGHHFADDIFKCISLNENIWILLQILLKLVPEVQINNIPALVSIMAWRRQGDKPLSEPMMASLLTHICVANVLLLCHTLATRLNGKVLIIWNISHSKNFFIFIWIPEVLFQGPQLRISIWFGLWLGDEQAYDNPLLEPTLTQFIDTYMHCHASMN